MKVWEEMWSLSGSCDVNNENGTVAMFGSEVCDYERARLVSAAPDMVRVLLEIEWSAQDGNGCPSCGGRRQPAFAEDSGVGHASSCELDAALRKAGVR